MFQDAALCGARARISVVGSLVRRLVLVLSRGILGRGIPPGDGANVKDMGHGSGDGGGESARELKGPTGDRESMLAHHL